VLKYQQLLELELMVVTLIYAAAPLLPSALPRSTPTGAGGGRRPGPWSAPFPPSLSPVRGDDLMLLPRHEVARGSSLGFDVETALFFAREGRPADGGAGSFDLSSRSGGEVERRGSR
jgi:hypothetical protein